MRVLILGADEKVLGLVKCGLEHRADIIQGIALLVKEGAYEDITQDDATQIDAVCFLPKPVEPVETGKKKHPTRPRPEPAIFWSERHIKALDGG